MVQHLGNIRPLSKLHLVAKIAIFGIFSAKFFDHVYIHALKIFQKICIKVANFIKQSEFRKRSIVAHGINLQGLKQKDYDLTLKLLMCGKVYKIINWKDLKSYFHDGSINGFEQSYNKISVMMESAEISDNEFVYHLELSENQSFKALKGKLHLEDNLDIESNGQPVLEKLKMIAESATILDFEVTANQINFFIKWTNYPQGERESRLFVKRKNTSDIEMRSIR